MKILRPCTHLRRQSAVDLSALVVAGLCALAPGCGDDAADPVKDTAVTDTAATDTSAGDVVNDSSANDSAAEATADAAAPPFDTAGLSACEKDCVTAHPEGAVLLKGWLDCQVESCAEFDPESEEGGFCNFMSWTPDNPEAACGAETRACFSGPDAGCKELVDLAAVRCEPAELPMSEDQLMGAAAMCMINLGFNATPAVQALAWPLYMCVFGDPSQGCGIACRDGAAACRACAAEQCKDLYDGCIANSSGTAITLTPPTGDKARCQDAFTCMNSCAGP